LFICLLQSAPLTSKFKLKWRRCADLPIPMGYAHHVVRINNQVYCGGGYTGHTSTYIKRLIHKYDPIEDQWSPLPICPTYDFGLTQLDGKPVIVGGMKPGDDFTPLTSAYVLEEQNEWKPSIPPFPTARWYPSAFSFESSLIVCGGITGWTDYRHFTCGDVVEIYENKRREWLRADPVPFSLYGMSFGIVHDTIYLIGGANPGGVLNNACSAYIPSLIKGAVPPGPMQASPSPSVWKVLPNTPTYGPTAAILGGFFLALGGLEPDVHKGSTLIHVYSPSHNEWVKITRELQVPQFRASTAQLTTCEIIIVAGSEIELSGSHEMKMVFTASVEL